MVPLAVEKVQTITNFLHRDRVLLCAVFEDQLLKEQERAFMGDFLADLNKGFPCIFGGEASAIWTLSVLDEVFDFERLF